MIEKLENRALTLRTTLDKTLQRLSETKGAFTEQDAILREARDGLHDQNILSTAERERAGLPPASSLAQSRHIEHILDGKQELIEVLHKNKAEITLLEESLGCERIHSAKLEEFVHSIAFLSPTGRNRTGGGFAIDDTCREAARCLLREIHGSSGGPSPSHRLKSQ